MQKCQEELKELRKTNFNFVPVKDELKSDDDDGEDDNKETAGVFNPEQAADDLKTLHGLVGKDGATDNDPNSGQTIIINIGKNPNTQKFFSKAASFGVPSSSSSSSTAKPSPTTDFLVRPRGSVSKQI